MSRRKMTAVYSPICACNAVFVRTVRKWARQAGVQLQSVPYHNITGSIRRWYSDAGVLDQDGLRRTVFIDLFMDGKLISSSVPPDREAVAGKLGVSLTGATVEPTAPPEPAPVDFPDEIASGRIRPTIITADTYRKEMQLCVDHHPGGGVSRRYRAACLELKEPVFRKTLGQQAAAGLFLQRDDRVLGLVEVHPREVLREYGFVTGRGGEDLQHLTIGCYEVARGMPRLQVLDALMSSLLDRMSLFDRPFLEGVGKVEWPEGFNPYWVYDKYGFQRAEELRPGWHVMTRRVDC